MMYIPTELKVTMNDLHLLLKDPRRFLSDVDVDVDTMDDSLEKQNVMITCPPQLSDTNCQIYNTKIVSYDFKVPPENQKPSPNTGVNTNKHGTQYKTNCTVAKPNTHL